MLTGTREGAGLLTLTNQSDLFAGAGAAQGRTGPDRATPPPEFHPGGCDLNIRVLAPSYQLEEDSSHSMLN